MKNNTIAFVVTSLVLGLIFVGIGVIYWYTPAGSLPHFFPGFQSGSLIFHHKHAFASIIVAALLFILAWFKSGEKEPQKAK